ncbi:MAG: hypothetical protein V4598_06315 [Bdellovibrionota bacterium]
MIKTIIFALLIFPLFAHAAFVGSIEFTAREISDHQTDVDTIVPTASECLKKTYDRHLAFHRRYGISPYYGDQSSFAKLTYEQKKSYLRSLRKDENLVDQMETISCVGLAMRCLSQGFAAAGKQVIWKRLEDHLRLNGVDGTALQYSLRKLGWKTLYWNPQISMNEEWDRQEKLRNPQNLQRSWGWHAYRWSTILSKGMYYDNHVDDKTTLVNFGTKQPLIFKRLPFFLGTAHTGYHVFPGMNGQVIESHSLRKITDITTIESSEFNPLKPNGGPQGTMYSGLMSVPPGYGI